MEDKIVRILLKRYQKISYKGGIAKVIFDDEFEDIAEEIVKLFSIPPVVGQSEQLSDEPEYCNKHKWNDCECTDVCRRGLIIT